MLFQPSLDTHAVGQRGDQRADGALLTGVGEVCLFLVGPEQDAEPFENRRVADIPEPGLRSCGRNDVVNRHLTCSMPLQSVC